MPRCRNVSKGYYRTPVANHAGDTDNELSAQKQVTEFESGYKRTRAISSMSWLISENQNDRISKFGGRCTFPAWIPFLQRLDKIHVVDQDVGSGQRIHRKQRQKREASFVEIVLRVRMQTRYGEQLLSQQGQSESGSYTLARVLYEAICSPPRWFDREGKRQSCIHTRVPLCLHTGKSFHY